MSLISLLAARHTDLRSMFLGQQNLDSPLFRFRMEQASSATLTEEISANNGTFTGSGHSFEVAGPWANSKAINFTGATRIEGFATKLYESGSGSCTIEALVSISDITARMGLCGMRESSGLYGLVMRSNSTTSGKWYPYVTGGFSFEASTAVVNNQWHHIALAYNYNADSYLYLNGTQIASGNLGTTNVRTYTGVIAGEKGSTSTECWKGKMSMVTFYNTALSAARILAHAQAGGFA